MGRKSTSLPFRPQEDSVGLALTRTNTGVTTADADGFSLAPQESRTSTKSGRSIRSVMSNAFRPKKSRKKLRKNNLPPPPGMAPLQQHREKYRQLNGSVDPQKGENLDYTTIIHSLGLNEHPEGHGGETEEEDNRPPGEDDIASLSPALWEYIAEYISPADRASLAFSSKTLLSRLGFEPWWALNLPENGNDKIAFLVYLDRQLPGHLLCFPCKQYHRRTKIGQERLKPANVLNPLFNCPNARNMLIRPARHRISPGRTLPFAFVQLVMRAHRFNITYGITAEALNRRWARDGWTHNTRFMIDRGRLLMRVTSSAFAPPDLPPTMQRMLLYNREDYWPYFSACQHWRDGELMPVCKCALTHVPKPRETTGPQAVEHKFKDRVKGRIYDPNAVASLCGKCRPMRRCPDCPTEYLVEIKLTEDRDPSDIRGLHFRQAIVVTRWSDLGDGTSPLNPEWAACNGEYSGFDSFKALGRRSISSIFESAVTVDTIPGQRIISLNPSRKREGEKGTDWY